MVKTANMNNAAKLKATGYQKLVLKLKEKIPSYLKHMCFFNDIATYVSLSKESES